MVSFDSGQKGAFASKNSWARNDSDDWRRRDPSAETTGPFNALSTRIVALFGSSRVSWGILDKL